MAKKLTAEQQAEFDTAKISWRKRHDSCVCLALRDCKIVSIDDLLRLSRSGKKVQARDFAVGLAKVVCSCGFKLRRKDILETCELEGISVELLEGNYRDYLAGTAESFLANVVRYRNMGIFRDYCLGCDVFRRLPFNPSDSEKIELLEATLSFAGFPLKKKDTNLNLDCDLDSLKKIGKAMRAYARQILMREEEVLSGEREMIDVLVSENKELLATVADLQKKVAALSLCGGEYNG